VSDGTSKAATPTPRHRPLGAVSRRAGAIRSRARARPWRRRRPRRDDVGILIGRSCTIFAASSTSNS
jgi:hypothetical protein